MAESALIGKAVDRLEKRGTTPTTGLETGYAELLAEVLKVDSVSVDSHFFEDLGADSLVMAHFCARVRKRGNLPPVSMRDVYRYPTIQNLAAALAEVAPRPVTSPVPVFEAPVRTRAGEYVLCGVLQAMCFLAYSYVAVLAIMAGYRWVSAGTGAVEIYLRLVLAGTGAFLAACAVPIAAKWVLVGRWKSTRIRLWSLAYVRFWVVK